MQPFDFTSPVDESQEPRKVGGFDFVEPNATPQTGLQAFDFGVQQPSQGFDFGVTRLDPTPTAAYDEMPTWAKMATSIIRMPTNFKTGALNIFGSLTDTVLMGLHEGGLVDDETAKQWRKWGRQTNQFVAQGVEGALLNEAIKRIESAPPGTDLAQVMAESDNFFTGDLMQGLGSLAAFGITSRLLSPHFARAGMTEAWAQFAGAGILGAVVNSNHLYHDAVEHDATGRQKGIAWAAGAITGPLEGISIGRMLGRFDSIGAKAFTKLIQRPGANPWRALSGTQSAVAGVKGMIEEGIQEFAQEWLGNYTAKTIAGYDPNRGYMENVWTAGGTGAATGFIGSAFLAAMGVRHGRIKALRNQEWAVKDGHAVPPEESGWTLTDEGMYTKAGLVIEPIEDHNGNTRWQLKNTQGVKDTRVVEPTELLEEFGKMPQSMRDVELALEGGDLVFTSPVMETMEDDGAPSWTQVYSPLEETVQNNTDMESYLILPKNALVEANKGVDVFGSWMKPETAANLGDRYISQGHMGLPLGRRDFFGEFNAITELHYELVKKRQEIIAQVGEDAHKLDQNAEWLQQFEKIAEQVALYESGSITPLAIMPRKKDTPETIERKKANVRGLITADTAFGLLDADRAVSQRQGIMPTSFANNRLAYQKYLPDSDRVFVGKKGDPNKAPAGFLNILAEADVRARKGNEPLVVFSQDSTGKDPLTDKKLLAYIDSYITSTLKPLVSKAISRGNYKYTTAVDKDGKPWGKDKDGNQITKQENPAVIIRLNFAAKNANGFIVVSKDKNTFLVELSVGGMAASKQAVDAIDKNIQDLVAAQVITQAEAKDTKKQHYQRKRALLEKATRKVTDTLAHELGHFVTMNRVRELFQRYNAGVATTLEVNTLKALYQSYFEYLHNAKAYQGMRDIAFGEMLTEVDSMVDQWPGDSSKQRILQLFDVVDEVAGGQEARSSWTPNLLFGQYRRGFEEFLANQVARIYANEKLTPMESAAAAPIRDALKDLKKLAQDLNAVHPVGARPYKGVGDVIALMDVESAIRTSGALENLAPKTIKDIINNKVNEFDGDVIAAFNEGIDSFSKAHDMMLNIVQIAQLNPHIDPLQTYLELTQGWARKVGQTTNAAEQTLSLARKLKVAGKEKGAVLGRVLFHEAETGKHLTSQEKSALTNGKWTAEMQQVYDSIKSNYKAILDRMRKVTLDDARTNFAHQPDKLTATEAKINKDFDEMEAKPYFPFMRFGKWTITVKANREFVDTDGTTYKPGQIVRFETFDHRFDRARTMKQLQAKYGKDHTVGQGRMSDTRGSLQAMPISFLRAMESRLRDKLPQDVREEFNEIIQEYSPGESFRQAHMKRRKGTKGYNVDWQRSFAAYMRQAAGHIARMEYQPLMTQAIKDMEGDVKILNQTANGDKRSMITDFMKEHNEYVLNPSIEWSGLRGFMFQWFLGFNLKSAVVNSTQVPLVTYPYLAARYGDGVAIKELARAEADAILYYKSPQKMPHRRGKNFALGEREMIQELLDRQILEQSLATELALAASSQHLERYIVGPGVKRVWFKASEWGAMPFHTAEKLNRMASALAGYRLARDAGMGHAEATNAAHDTVLKTQYDYSKWNRPKFMRGRSGVVFLFMNYVQNTLFFGLGGDPGALRHQLMMFMFAGMMGMPFMEDIMTLFNWGSTKLKRALGSKDPYTDVRLEMRSFVNELTNNPDLFLHGISADSMGMGYLGRAAGLGAWTPEFDVSASISMGRIIPGIETLKEQGGNFESGLVRGVERSGGAFVSTAIQSMRALASNDPNTWKRAEKALPAFARNASKAARMATQGEEVTRGGQVIAEFDWKNPKDAMELIALTAGAQPRRSSLGWQQYIQEQQPVLYYEHWKRQIARQFNFAFSSEDREAIADMRKAVRRYNEAVPFPEMKITADYISQSYKTHQQQQQKARMGVPESLNHYRLQRRVGEVYNPPSSQDN